MLKSMMGALFMLALGVTAMAQEFRVITTVESIVPAGLGRSRMLDHQNSEDYRPLTTARSDGKKSDQSDVKREDVKIEVFEETKLLNFYSLTGINFQNIASNDAMIAAKVNELSKDGWKLMFMTSGVESNAGTQDGEGIFITRLMFNKSVSQFIGQY